MLWPIIYKEWIKLRLVLILSALTFVAFSLFSVYNLHHLITTQGSEHVWLAVMLRDAIFTKTLYWLPLIAGVSLATFQFLPEITSNRIKLTLHLPCDMEKSIGVMTFFGQAALLIMSAISMIIVNVGFSSVLADEIVEAHLMTMIPWFLTGIIAYTLGVFIYLEPTKLRRILYLILSVLILRVFFISNIPGAYNKFIIPMVVCLTLWSTLPLLSIWRYKRGKAS